MTIDLLYAPRELSGGVLKVEIRYSLWLISHGFYSSMTADLLHHLHF